MEAAASVADLLRDTLSVDGDSFEFDLANEPPRPVAGNSAPSGRSPDPAPSSPSLPHPGFRVWRAAAVAKLERAAKSEPSSPGSAHHGFHVWRAAAVAKLERAARSPPSLPSSSNWGFHVWRAAAVAKPERAATSPPSFSSSAQQGWCTAAVASLERPADLRPSFLTLGQRGFRVWRAPAVADFQRPAASETLEKTGEAIESIRDRRAGGRCQRAGLPEFARATNKPRTVAPSPMPLEVDAGVHLPAADLYDFDLVYKKTLKEVVFHPDVDRRRVSDATAASVPLVRRRSSLKLAVCAAVVATVGAMPWVIPSFREGVSTLMQRAHLLIMARPAATILSSPQVEERREAGPAVAASTPLATPQLPSFDESGRSSSASSDAPRDFEPDWLSGSPEAKASGSHPHIGDA